MKNISKPKVVSEIGCNHMGEFEKAKELIRLSKEAGAGYVKFQKRNNKELLTTEQYNSPHPVPNNSYGETYGAHREFLEFNTLFAWVGEKTPIYLYTKEEILCQNI